MYKLIALDIDGTLLDPSGCIRPRVRAAVTRAVAAGCVVTLATGRRHRSARRVAADLSVVTPLIMYSGSVVYDPQTEQALLHRTLSPRFVADAVALLRELGVSPGVFQSPVRGEGIFLGPPQHDDEYLGDFAAHPSRADLVTRRSYADLAHVADPLVVFAAGSSRVAGQLVECVNENGRLPCNFYSYSLRHSSLPDLYGFDLLPSGHSKAVALTWLAQHYGFDISQTLVVGDGHNDIEMLQAAGLGVAMDNAAPEVKAVADVIVSSNAEDGVAEAIERFVLA